MQRWKLSLYGQFLRYVDADTYTTDRIHGTRFLCGADITVCTISPEIYVRIDPVPTAHLRGGPRDGQVAPLPTTAPREIFFQAVVPLDADGHTLAPIPPAHLRELTETYIHALDCPCGGWRDRPRQHTYGWARDTATYMPHPGLPTVPTETP